MCSEEGGLGRVEFHFDFLALQPEYEGSGQKSCNCAKGSPMAKSSKATTHRHANA